MFLPHRLLFAACLFLSPGAAEAARTYGLVIGVNDYQHVQKLDGARADAEDIASALAKSGVTEIMTLLDRQATKANIVSAWQQIIGTAEKDDVIFVSYAGHGAQIPERIKGDENDGLDEFWVLPDFDPDNIPGTRDETLFDNELHQWFADAAARGIRIIFISDSCHAGGMERAVNGKLRAVQFGNQRLLGELMALVLKEGEAEPARERRLPDNVTLLAATSEALPVPEVVINGEPRGALSWSVARALEGMADSDADGIITRSELEDYILATVRMRSEALQTPVFTPLEITPDNFALLAVQKPEPERQQLQPETGSDVGSGLTADADPGALSPLRPQAGTQELNLALARELGFKPELALDVRGTAAKPRGTVGGSNPFVWDSANGTFESPNGDIAAEKVTPDKVDTVVQKFVLLDFLKALASRRPGEIRLSPVQTVYHAGERLKFEPIINRYKNMLVFNLANTGEVQYIDRMADGKPVDRTPLREMQVVAPFGADHLVAIFTDMPLDSVGVRVKDGISADNLFELLSNKVDFSKAAVAVLPIYTKQ